jgi:hypothetical protein
MIHSIVIICSLFLNEGPNNCLAYISANSFVNMTECHRFSENVVIGLESKLEGPNYIFSRCFARK